jgi:uncharacterized protein YxeA
MVTLLRCSLKIEVKVGVALVAVLATIYVALFYLPAQQQKKFEALLQQLNDSADKGDVAGVKSAMSRGIDAKQFNEKYDGAMLSPLHYAAGKGYTEIVRFLIDSGVRPNLRQREGKTALIVASQLGQSRSCSGSAILLFV